ncbi:MAG: hypothetical protein HY033_00535 [Ignavibacteriae bacterium]|nr:hypothetical protein [Ignavibacteria bacterium]MBI3363375.1 hypothetical protein [Ignavibacteriota bacterium]
MKLWTFAGIVAGFFLLALAAKKSSPRTAPVRQLHNTNNRYDVDDFVAGEEL